MWPALLDFITGRQGSFVSRPLLLLKSPSSDGDTWLYLMRSDLQGFWPFLARIITTWVKERGQEREMEKNTGSGHRGLAYPIQSRHVSGGKKFCVSPSPGDPGRPGATWHSRRDMPRATSRQMDGKSNNAKCFLKGKEGRQHLISPLRRLTSLSAKQKVLPFSKPAFWSCFSDYFNQPNNVYI